MTSKQILLESVGNKLIQVNQSKYPYISFHLYEQKLHRILWIWWYRYHLTGIMTQYEFIYEKKNNSLLNGENSERFYHEVIVTYIKGKSSTTIKRLFTR